MCILSETGLQNNISREFLHNLVTRQNFVLKVRAFRFLNFLGGVFSYFRVLQCSLRVSSIMQHFFGWLPEGQNDVWASDSGDCEEHCLTGFDAHSLVGVLRRFGGICCLYVSPNSLLRMWKLKRFPKVHSTWTHSTEQRAWETYSFPAGQDICCVLWEPKCKRPPLVPVLGQFNPVHAFPSRLFVIHMNIMLPSTPRFAVWSFSFRFPRQNSVFVFALRARCNLPSDCQLVKQNVA
jgi:hypothetical protein